MATKFFTVLANDGRTAQEAVWAVETLFGIRMGTDGRTLFSSMTADEHGYEIVSTDSPKGQELFEAVLNRFEIEYIVSEEKGYKDWFE